MSQSPRNPQLQLTIVSAHQQIFSGPVRMVSARSVVGDLGILPRHTPLLTLLQPGEVRIQMPEGDEEFIYVSGGMMEVQPFAVTILADTALRSDQIDEEAAQAARRKAEETIRNSMLFSDRDKAHAELLKAVAQLQTLQDARRRRKR